MALPIPCSNGVAHTYPKFPTMLDAGAILAKDRVDTISPLIAQEVDGVGQFLLSG